MWNKVYVEFAAGKRLQSGVKTRWGDEGWV